MLIKLLSDTNILHSLNKSLVLGEVLCKIVQVHLLKFLDFYPQKTLESTVLWAKRVLLFYNRMQCYNLKTYMNGYTAKDIKNRKLILLQCILD